MRSQRHRAVPTSASTQIEALETRCLLSAISPTFIAGAIANINSAQNAGANGIAFTDQDIGSPAVAGSSSYSNGTYSVTAAGTGIGGNGDQFNFAAVHFTGDGSVVARLASLVNTSTSAQAGIMIRSGTAANAAVAALLVTPSNQLQFI
ncbi:MAG TPA: hypothetical protein VLI90_09450, partial [Tepidisphaeraceae bacterium]|nr:hypothetical protein [Tepidisphaeraceae bacterium]